MPKITEGDGPPLLAASVPTCTTSPRPLRMSGGPRQHFLRLISGALRGLGPMLERLGLRAASLPYGWGVRLRNAAYERGWIRSQRPGAGR